MWLESMSGLSWSRTAWECRNEHRQACGRSRPHAGQCWDSTSSCWWCARSRSQPRRWCRGIARPMPAPRPWPRRPARPHPIRHPRFLPRHPKCRPRLPRRRAAPAAVPRLPAPALPRRGRRPRPLPRDHRPPRPLPSRRRRPTRPPQAAKRGSSSPAPLPAGRGRNRRPALAAALCGAMAMAVRAMRLRAPQTGPCGRRVGTIILRRPTHAAVGATAGARL